LFFRISQRVPGKETGRLCMPLTAGACKGIFILYVCYCFPVSSTLNFHDSYGRSDRHRRRFFPPSVCGCFSSRSLESCFYPCWAPLDDRRRHLPRMLSSSHFNSLSLFRARIPPVKLLTQARSTPRLLRHQAAYFFQF